MARTLDEIRLELDDLFAERDRLFPRREAENTQAVRSVVAAYADEVCQPQPEWKPDEQVLAAVEGLGERPLFICGYQKSGTTLLVQLLDGHPRLVVLPGDSHLPQLADQYTFLERPERVRQWRQHWLKRLVNPTGQAPFWFLGENDGAYRELSRYLGYFGRQAGNSGRRLAQSTALALAAAGEYWQRDPALWVAKTPRSERFALQMAAQFPEAKFIQVVRDPFHNLASMKRLAGLRGWRWNTVQTAVSIRKSTVLGARNQRQLGQERYIMVRYRDLVRATEVTMSRLAAWLGVRYREVMGRPTSNQKPASANSMYAGKKVRGVVNKEVGRAWRQEFGRWEVMAAKAIFAGMDRSTGYRSEG